MVNMVIAIDFDGNSPCIYGILNLKTNQYYIGSAVNIKKRLALHLKRLENNIHHSYLLQKEWNKNPTNFKLIILEVVQDRNLLINREQWWIDNTSSYYNIAKIAGSSLGIKRSNKTKELIREANLGIKHPEWRNKIKSKSQGGKNHWTKKKKFSEESRKKMKEAQENLYKNGFISPRKIKIKQFDLSNNFIRDWNSATDVEKELGFNRKAIVNCLKKKTKSSNNFIWLYA